MKFNQIAADHGRSILRHGLLISLIFIFMSPVASQSPPPPDPNILTGDFSPSMGVIVIVLIAALFFMGFFSIYIRHCSDDDSSVSNTRRISAVRSRRGAPRGLDTSVIESFPTFDYSAVKTLKIGKGALECAVCLNEFEDDETLRLIPKCDHVFHPECIDAWLAAHTTCPVCRANLAPGESVHALELGQISEAHQANEEGGEDQIIGAENQNDDVVIDVVGQPVGPTGPVQCGDAESMEQPLNSSLSRLNRNRTRRNISGRPRWFGKFSRSNSTGHVAVKQWENMDRFTLRLPEEVRRQIMSGKLSRTTSCVVLPREGSSRRGNRPVWTGEGSNRGRLFGSDRFDRPGRSDRWVFSLTPPFFSRAPSLKSPKVTASAGGSLHSTKADDSVHAVAELKLPPV